jgi:hypothetical protein
VESGNKYCSESCSDAGSGDVEVAGECGPATCSTSIEEVAQDLQNSLVLYLPRRLFALELFWGWDLSPSLLTEPQSDSLIRRAGERNFAQ